MEAEMILRYVCPEISEVLKKAMSQHIQELLEIRLRAGSVLSVRTLQGVFFIQRNGALSEEPKGAVPITMALLQKILHCMSGHSLYAYENEIRQGFLTLPGGHRVGITGTAVMEGGSIRNIQAVSGLNIRIARQFKGCAEPLLPWIRSRDSIHNTLLLSSPGCGKTTMLRDLIRLVSSVDHHMVSVVDERGEIAGSIQGVPRFDIGACTDVLSACPKKQGMLMMLRSMGPEILAVDEIGDVGESEILLTVLNSGVKLLCTIHGEEPQQLLKKPVVSEIMQLKLFDRIVVLSGRQGPGTIEHIYNGEDLNVLI